MAQRPPRMPRRPAGPGSQDQSRHDGSTAPHSDRPPHSDKVLRLPREDSGADATEIPTDAIHVVPPAKAGQREPRRTVPRQPRSGQPGPVRSPSTGQGSASAAPTGRRARDAAQDPGATGTPGTAAGQGRAPRLERAKQKQSQRRMVDRVKFSAAVRRKPGEPAVPQAVEPEREPVAAHRFSGRVAALLVVLAFFAVMLVPTVNHYRNQMHEINELRASIDQLQTQQHELKEEIARWDDPLYIKQQARDRINLVMPGERVYMVVGEQPSAQDEQPHNASTYEVRQELPWVDALLDSMCRAATD